MSDRPQDNLLPPSGAENSSHGKKVNKKTLVNILNYINFQDKTILINFKHAKYNSRLSIPAKPEPCDGDSLKCTWIKSEEVYNKLKLYEFVDISIPYGRKLILVKPELKGISGENISFILPETCYEFNARQTIRHPCRDIQVELIQNGAIFYGELIDFSAKSFRVEISAIPPQTFQWISPHDSVNIIFKNEQGIIYSGDCRIIRQSNGHKTRSFALEPVNNQIRRFKPKEFRSLRQKLSPSPSIIFKHSLTRKTINLEVEDISGSGFSVEEYNSNSVLLPGMIIPQLEIEFANDFTINCKAQVIYRNVQIGNGENWIVKCGFAFLDMDIHEQTKLSSLLHHAANRKSYVCNRVDMDELWNFFFETGFVYPKKYAQIYANKEKFIETYEKLYHRNQHIARHFVYLDRGVIQGHMSMIRFYENTWLIHHHASNASGFSKAGLIVLNQIGKYINDFHSLQSTQMNFVACYFRPENKFPNRVFGGFVNGLNNPKGVSIDTFAYFYFPKNFTSWDLSSLMLTQTQRDHLLELKGFYDHESSGLMLSALDLEPGMIELDNLRIDYKEAGFKRERHIFSLSRGFQIEAIIIVNLSDFGLNLSNLNNSMHIFVMNPKLPRQMLLSGISMLTKYYDQPEIPILLYPVSYAEKELIPYEKKYSLWVLNMQNTDDYFRYIDKLLKRFN